jgi:hypothetical protein
MFPSQFNIKVVWEAFLGSISQVKRFLIIFSIICGFGITILTHGHWEENRSVINSFLTSFVPLFATILTVYISWTFDKNETKHNKERMKLFKETTVSIMMLIPITIITLGISLLCNIHVLDNLRIFERIQIYDWEIINNPLFMGGCLRFFFNSLYFTNFVGLSLVIFMIVKRSYIIIIKELRLLNSSIKQQ